MGLVINFVSLNGTWPAKPTPTYRRKNSPFKAGWSSTIELLERELQHLKATNIVIQADCDRSEIRIDGQLRANAKLNGPGVVIAFESPSKGALSFPCDTFTEWKANVRGIALSLEALRAVDRYGVTQQAEQYKGWTALPDVRNERQTRRKTAAEWICQQCFAVGESNPPTVATLLNDSEIRRIVYKRLAVLLHPDRIGNDERFKQLQTYMAAFIAE